MADDPCALPITVDRTLLFEDEQGQLTLLMPERTRVRCERCGAFQCHCLSENQTCSSCLQWPRCQRLALLDGVPIHPDASVCAWTPPLFLPTLPHQT